MAAENLPSQPAPDVGGRHLQDIEFLDLQAYIYLQHGLPDKAAVLLLARDLLAPDNARALLSLALAQLRSAKPGKALQTLERLAILGAMGAEFHLVRAQALHALEQHAESASAMRAYVALATKGAAPEPSSEASA